MRRSQSSDASANLCHRGAGFIDQPDPEQKAMVHAVSVVLFYLIWLEGPRVCRLAAGGRRIRTSSTRAEFTERGVADMEMKDETLETNIGTDVLISRPARRAFLSLPTRFAK